MHSIEIFQVDAFTDKVFHGNPAAVCLLNEWLNDELLQAIAIENNLSETAFVIEGAKGYELRWFTPNCEINLCGHATLAAAFILFEQGVDSEEPIIFSSLSGPLAVWKKGEKLLMDFPRFNFTPIDAPDILQTIIDQPIQWAYTSELDYLVVLAEEKQVASAQIDLHGLARLPKRGLALTGPSNEVDYYSRCFYPKHNIPEDPVTGSAHCVLAPYWSQALNKSCLHSQQGSFRKGEIFCEVLPERIYISGYCKWYFKGRLVI